jgi:F0F1-type ATP synthase membrane subunit b/b'
MPTLAARQRRLRNVAEGIIALDIELDAKELRRRLVEIQEQAKRALDENQRRGNPMIAEARAKAAEANRRIGKATERRVRPVIKQLRAEGFTTYEALAKELNKRRIHPPIADKWSKSSVRNIELRHRQV